jgi:hypothetical protein
VAEFESDTAAEVTGLPSPGEGPETVGGAVRGPLVTGMRARAWADGRCTWPRSCSIRRWFHRPVAVVCDGTRNRIQEGVVRAARPVFAVELSSSAVLSFVIGLLICGIEIAYSEIEFLYNTVSCCMVELSFAIIL